MSYLSFSYEAAKFAADVAGYSRLANRDELGTLRTLIAHPEIMDRLIAEGAAATISLHLGRAYTSPKVGGSYGSENQVPSFLRE
jgi:hypothetical protein